jgi:hypothetical protein
MRCVLVWLVFVRLVSDGVSEKIVAGMKLEEQSAFLFG